MRTLIALLFCVIACLGVLILGLLSVFYVIWILIAEIWKGFIDPDRDPLYGMPDPYRFVTSWWDWWAGAARNILRKGDQ